MTTPSVCDGSCFANHKPGDEIRCEDGEVLVFYLCVHDDTWFLVTLAPPYLHSLVPLPGRFHKIGAMQDAPIEEEDVDFSASAA